MNSLSETVTATTASGSTGDPATQDPGESGRALRVVRDTYTDSLLLLVVTSVMTGSPGVGWAGAVMGTPAGRENLREQGFEPDAVGANDLVLAVRARSAADAQAALDAGDTALTQASSAAGTTAGAAAGPAPRSMAAAVRTAGPCNVAIISVPGAYAALEAHHALTAGLHVLLFSDNVPLEEERELKRRAVELGLLVMGPGAGTAVVAGTGLGFANAVRRGPVGVVAAAGTGAQEVSALLDRWGVGVSHVIGVGGRDLSEDVGGLMAISAARALAADPQTEAILLVSKPPAPSVAAQVLAACGETPTVATFLGLSEIAGSPSAQLARTLEDGARRVAGLVGHRTPEHTADLAEQVRAAIRRLDAGPGAGAGLVRGYYSGGTLCYEAQLIISELLGAVHSNEPLVAANTVPAQPDAHVLLDLGAEEYTDGRPHPMIDPTLRIDMMRREARAPGVAVVLIDVVLGFGAHDDPAGQLAGVCAEIMADGGPQVIAYVLGSANDPQDYPAQVATLRAAGALVTETAADAARAAAAIAGRRLEWLQS